MCALRAHLFRRPRRVRLSVTYVWASHHGASCEPPRVRHRPASTRHGAGSLLPWPLPIRSPATGSRCSSILAALLSLRVRHQVSFSLLGRMQYSGRPAGHLPSSPPCFTRGSPGGWQFPAQQPLYAYLRNCRPSWGRRNTDSPHTWVHRRHARNVGALNGRLTAHEAGAPLRPLEGGGIYADCGCPAAQLMRDSLGGEITAVLPNTRLKLSAPCFCAGHLFVNDTTLRRSLSAIR